VSLKSDTSGDSEYVAEEEKNEDMDFIDNGDMDNDSVGSSKKGLEGDGDGDGDGSGALKELRTWLLN
jgi:hypothetical protein